MKRVHVINVYEEVGDNSVMPRPDKTIYVESEMSREEMQRFVLGRGLSSLADNDQAVHCMQPIEILSVDEFAAAHPLPTPKRRLGNKKKRRLNPLASIALKRSQRTSSP